MNYLAISLTWIGVLLLPNLVWLWVATDVWDALIRGIPPSLTFLVALLAWTHRPRWVMLGLLPLYGLLPFEFYYQAVYGQPTSDHVLALVTESSASEAFQYVGYGPLFVGSGASIGLMLATVWIACQCQSLPRHRWLVLLRWASLLPLLQYGWLEWDWMQQTQHIALSTAPSESELLTQTNEVSTPMGATLSDSYPLGVFFRFRDFLGERERIRIAAERIRQFDFQVHQVGVSSEPETYVLVIGESARPDHWSLNGYSRDTAPRLSEIPRLVSFQNVISAWPATRLAVPVILVGQQASNHRAEPDRASIVSLFKQGGFHTYWLSNQAPLGLHDSIIAVHAQEADELVFTNPTDHTQAGNHDGVLIPIFKKMLEQPYPRKMFVIHMMGSHKRYDLRYPSEFRHFLPDELGKIVGDASASVVNSYDNSVAFTDHVLAELISELDRISGGHSALLYLSDHGQTLPVNGCDTDGHGRRNEADFRVAALLWMSESLHRQRPHLLEQARKLKDAPLESVGAFHALAELARLRFPDWNPQRSWVSPDWQPRTRWTNAVPDFDRAERESPCGKLIMH